MTNPQARYAKTDADVVFSTTAVELITPSFVDDGDEADVRAKKLSAEIAAEIRDEEYGQHHFLVVDPNGLLLNVMSTI